MDNHIDENSQSITKAEGGDSVESSERQGLRASRRSSRPSSLSSDAVDPVVCKEHRQEIKYFCKNHMTELCITCRRMEHENCNTVIGIEEAVDDIYNDSHGEKIIQSVKDLIERFQDCKVASKKLQSLFPNKRQDAVDKVKQARKNIDDYLDELEDSVVAEIDRNIKGEMHALEEKIHVSEASLSSLSTTSSDIDRTMSVGNKEEKFIAMNRATQQIKQYCSLLLKMKGEMSEMNVTFEANNALTDVFQSLGTVSVETSEVTDVFSDTKPIYTGETKLKKDADDEPPFASSIDVLRDGRKLVLDYNNDKIQFYDKNNSFLTEAVLPVKGGDLCLSVVLNSNTEALISTRYGRLLKVMIGDELVVSEIKTDYKIYTMTKYGEDVLCVLNDNNQFKAYVMDKSMKKTLKTILKDDGKLFKAPAFLGVSADKNTIYVLDHYKGCYGITLNDHVIFHYQNPQAQCYGGLVVDSEGLFIGSKVAGDYQIEKLNLSGEQQEVCANFGDSYPLKLMENELVVFQYDVRSIKFYCFLK